MLHVMQQLPWNMMQLRNVNRMGIVYYRKCELWRQGLHHAETQGTHPKTLLGLLVSQQYPEARTPANARSYEHHLVL